METQRCPRCGKEVPANEWGRPAIWCSARCRRAAYNERQAAKMGVVAVQVREVTRAREPDWDEVVTKVLSSPKAVRRVLDGLEQRRRSGALGGVEWDQARADVYRLAVQLAPEFEPSRRVGY